MSVVKQSALLTRGCSLAQKTPTIFCKSVIPAVHFEAEQEPTMQDRRQVQRTRVLKNAKIILNNSSSLCDCTVVNLTNMGSCIQMASAAGIPGSFALSFDRALSTRECRVIWRSDNKLGVSFD
jgi:hypothetical protein